MYPHLKQDLGPPEPPKMRSPSEPGQRKVSIFRADDRHYPTTARMSSDLLRPVCAALSANEPTEWICGRVASRKEAIPKERYAADEKGPAIGTWRETGAGAEPPSSGKGFNLAKYKAAAQPKRLWIGHGDILTYIDLVFPDCHYPLFGHLLGIN